MQPYADEAETWVAAAEAFNERPLAYVHLSDQLTIGAEKMPEGFGHAFRQAYRGTLMAAGGFDRDSAERALASGDLDLIAFGRPFIANPDLVDRLKHGHPSRCLNVPPGTARRVKRVIPITRHGLNTPKRETQRERGTMTSMEMRLAALLDIEDIRQLRLRYSQSLDSGDIDGLDRVFAVDALVEVTIGAMQGIDTIKAGLAEAYRQFDRDGRNHYPFLHVIANHQVALTGPDTAEGSCYLVDFETASKPDPNPLLLLGLYHDRYRRIDGAWRISETRLDVIWPSADPSEDTA
jgi:hypothetical protein